MGELVLTFEIELGSDYHVGAGYGRGKEIDSVLLRDADGVPVIRGTSLSGLLRDGLYRLLQHEPLRVHYRPQCRSSGLARVDNAPDYCAGEEICPVCRLFGTPKRPKGCAFSSARPAGFPTPLAAKEWHKNKYGSFPSRRARISPSTRRAEPRKLFSQENGDARLRFRFTVSWAANDDATLDEASLLVAAARNVRQLGRSRRRGLGECLFHLVDVEGVPDISGISCQDWFLDRFYERWLSGKTERKSINYVVPAAQPAQFLSGEPVRLLCIARLDEPLIIAERSPAGNQYDTRLFIPGPAFRGGLASLAAQRADLGAADSYSDFLAVFLREGVWFTALYPAYHRNSYLYPSIPLPRDLLTCKLAPFGSGETWHYYFDQKDHHYGYASKNENGLEDCPVCKEKGHDMPQGPVSGFAALRPGEFSKVEPALDAELHIRIDPASNRASRGDLYGYTALEPGQYFLGEIVCASQDAWEKFQGLTGVTEKEPVQIRLGKAARRGYGLTTIWLEKQNDQNLPWIRLPLKNRLPDVTQPFTLTLLTDAVITDNWGRMAAGFEEEWLERELGLGRVEIINAFSSGTLVDGFNSHLGLPRWRDIALSAGSAVGLRLPEPPDDWLERMEQLESGGIGLRRSEGLGRLAFNHPIYRLKEGISRAEILLPECMRLSSAGSEQDPVKEKKFIVDWDKRLAEFTDELGDLCKDSRFTALARWIYACSESDPDELLQKINMLGKPDNVLIKTIGEYEYGNRNKENFFDNDGRKGIEPVKEILYLLKTENPAFWLVGVKMLAGRIEEAVASKRGGAQ
ncbi:MAG: hypothetical protein C4589_08855 [Peptococcaceae bacterium]|nr:MAG: hypothetical protein C4589_08855 [Peptococcaceae bacterium]